MHLNKTLHGSLSHYHFVKLHLQNDKLTKSLIVLNQTTPGNKTLRTLKDVWWVCGNKAYILLPHGWIGCCYMATLKLQNELLTIDHSRAKRAMAQCNKLESFHWIIHLGETWGIGLFPWYGVTFWLITLIV